MTTPIESPVPDGRTLLRRPKLDLPVLAQRNGTVRLGWHPERSYVVTPPPDVSSDVLADVLLRLDGIHSRAHSIWYAETVGLSANAMSTLLAELAESGLLSEAAQSTPPHSCDRSGTVVRLVGRGPIADAIDAGTTPTSTLVLRRSAEVPARMTNKDHADWDCNMVVLTDDMVPDPGVVTGLVRRRIPHLHVRLRDGLGIVGPFVVPGVSSCLRCADLYRCGLEPQWPHIAAQLLGRVGDASKPTVLATAAVALAQIEAFVDGRHVPLTNTTMEIDLTTHTMKRRIWSRHPLCDCSL